MQKHGIVLMSAAGAVLIAAGVWLLSRPAAGPSEVPQSQIGAASGALAQLTAALDAIEAEGTASRPERGHGRTSPASVQELLKLDPKDRSYETMQRLLDAYKSSDSGSDREAILAQLATRHRLYVDETGDVQFVDFIYNVAAASPSARERSDASIALHTLSHPRVVDALIRLIDSAHSKSRFYAAEGLAWVRGDERDRALKSLRAAIHHADPAVRGIAALSLAVVARDADAVPHMIERLRSEPLPEVSESLVKAC